MLCWIGSRDAGARELGVGRLERREVVEAPRHVDQAGLVGGGPGAGGALDQRDVVMLLAEAQERDASVRVPRDHLEADGPRVERDRCVEIAHVEDHVAQSSSLDHPSSLLVRRPVPSGHPIR